MCLSLFFQRFVEEAFSDSSALALQEQIGRSWRSTAKQKKGLRVPARMPIRARAAKTVTSSYASSKQHS
jgi:hypothetical protein